MLTGFIRGTMALALLMGFARFVPAQVAGVGAKTKATSPPRPREPKPPASVPLEVPAEDEGPSYGLDLDAAIHQLLAANYDLAVKFQDIPKARADILSAGLIENPSVFLSSDGIPYGNYSEQRPGATSYEITAVQPTDVSGKRRWRIRVAERAERSLEALYQDAMRQEIDKLYTRFVDVLEARQGVRAARGGLESLPPVAAREEGKPEARPRWELAEASVRKTGAELAVRKAEAALSKARSDLALLLGLPVEQADRLRLRGSLRVGSPPLPCTDDLVRLALQTRPDLAAYRISMDMARANGSLVRAETFEDLLLFYTPYQAVNFPSQGKQTAAGWEAGGLTMLPVFDRNQGNILRARVNVEQLQIESRRQEREVIDEVRGAAAEHELSGELVRRYERDVLANARLVREEKYRLFVSGQKNLDAVLEAERDYDEIVGQYLEALVRHRRAMLKLNTAVGQRLLP